MAVPASELINKRRLETDVHTRSTGLQSMTVMNRPFINICPLQERSAVSFIAHARRTIIFSMFGMDQFHDTHAHARNTLIFAVFAMPNS